MLHNHLVTDFKNYTLSSNERIINAEKAIGVLAHAYKALLTTDQAAGIRHQWGSSTKVENQFITAILNMKVLEPGHVQLHFNHC